MGERDDYWGGRAREGVLIGGGPWRDGSGELLLCEAPDRTSLFRILDQDPGIRSGTLALANVREWDVVRGVSLPDGRRCSAGDARAADGVGTTGAADTAPTAEAEELTPHEERIAAMVVDGMTNRRIAETLSVSTRAVELRITRIYLKLAIQRRAQLAPALSRRRNAEQPPQRLGPRGPEFARLRFPVVHRPWPGDSVGEIPPTNG
ncbi:helix-turn-helix transcriptional regulator [Kitasatospora sp. SUK 42]|uniref:response regulator transcription factor n=1 Tax=Kitasatospora sp. SUK 42 TaxID=1588882 RepID=UPI0027E27699|nr:helix-turn-helix transcriptional regulator [Kitasatospora sp. SUK 42]